jgi:UDP-glucose 4-epimerase
MDVLVTGGGGFIGSHLAERFVEAGHAVTVLDNFEPFYDTRLKRYNVDRGRAVAASSDGSYRLVEADVRDADAMADVVAGADIVYHQAARSGVRLSVEDPQKYDETNVDGTLTLLDAAIDHDIERFVLASSSSVYGAPSSLPSEETHPTKPVSPYGASKLAAERYALAYSEVYDLPVVALRYFTVYGPRMRPNMAISNFVARCATGRSPVVYGDGSQTRDFTYIEDVVEANASLLSTDAADGEALNIGSTDTIDIETIAREIRDHLAPDLDVVYAEPHDADVGHTHAACTKAHARIGYEPSTPIRRGVEQFVEWYRENREWYEPLVLDG